jgi:FtsX-like permease family protein
MTAAVRLWWLVRRRSAGRSDPQALTSVLAVIAFGATTAILLVVLGGIAAFDGRAAGLPLSDVDSTYPVLARIAAALLLIPLVTLGGAAARLVVARRDARLATLRLCGATTSQVAVVTLLEAGSQALAGGVAGLLGYAALLPAVARLRFEGRTFGLGELWVGVPTLLAAVGAVTVVALLSAVSSLRRVAITPLGVAARVRPAGLRAVRLLAMLLVAVVFAITMRSGVNVPVAVLVGLLVLGFATINVVGPFVAYLQGRIVTARAKDVATLLAGRRLMDQPRTAWRTVGGVSLATFIAGIASVMAVLDTSSTSASDRQYLADLSTGALLTLAIAGVLAAVSTGVMQSGRVIDQRDQYRALALAGTDLAVLDKARMKETLLPLYAAIGTSLVAVGLLLVPAMGMSSFAHVDVALRFAGSVLVASLLVVAGAAASRSTMRVVLRDDAR